MNNKIDEKEIKKHKLLINIIGIILFIGICALLLILIAPNFKDYIEDPIKFKEYISDNGFIGIIIFLFVQILQIVVSIIPGEMIEIAAGITFGWFLGLILCLIGVALATSLIFVVCKKLGKPYIDKLVGNGKLKLFDKLNSSTKRDTIIFIIFLIPGIPKDLLVYAAAFFDIKLSKFLLLSIPARIPSIITSTIAGQYILEGNYKPVIIIFAVMIVITILGYLLYMFVYNRHKKNQEK